MQQPEEPGDEELGSNGDRDEALGLSGLRGTRQIFPPSTSQGGDKLKIHDNLSSGECEPPRSVECDAQDARSNKAEYEGFHPHGHAVRPVPRP